jgi:hypothetical protein
MGYLLNLEYFNFNKYAETSEFGFSLESVCNHFRKKFDEGYN